MRFITNIQTLQIEVSKFWERMENRKKKNLLEICLSLLRFGVNREEQENIFFSHIDLFMLTHFLDTSIVQNECINKL